MTWRTGTKNRHNLYFDLGSESIAHGFLIEPEVAQRIAEAMNEQARKPSRWAPPRTDAEQAVLDAMARSLGVCTQTVQYWRGRQARDNPCRVPDCYRALLDE